MTGKRGGSSGGGGGKGRVLGCILSLAAVTLGAAGCGILDPSGEVEVRVRNGSARSFDEATLILPKGPLIHLDLEPGEETLYVAVSKAYRIASAEVVMGQDTARAQVIDYVGETPLKPGRYTYIFRVYEGVPPHLGLEFEKDS